MASLSSSSSVSSSSSLGNTALRGFGGLASGIDRDAIIEKMTLGTNTKITNQESEITKLEWKQEIYRGISDNILDLYDNYSSYTSSSNLKDPAFFAKSIITAVGKDTATRFVSASGTSQLTSSVAIQAVRELATSSVRKSQERTDGKIETSLKNLGSTVWQESFLAGGRQLRFGQYNSADGTLDTSSTKVFELPTSYKNEAGDTVEIDYFTTDYEKLATQLNDALKASNMTLGAQPIDKAIQFAYEEGKMKIKPVDGADLQGYAIQSNSSALQGLGYTGSTGGTGKIEISDYNSHLKAISESAVKDTDTLEYLSGKSMKFSYDGVQKDITLLTTEEAKAIREGKWTISKDEQKRIEDEIKKQYDITTEKGKNKLEELVNAGLKSDIRTELFNKAKEELGEDATSEQIVEKAKELLQAEFDDKNDPYTVDDIDEAIEHKLQQRVKELQGEMGTNGDDKYTEMLEAKREEMTSDAAIKDAIGMEQMRSNIQTRLDRAFGKNAVKAELTDSGKLAFSTKADSTVSVSTDDVMLLYNMGIRNGESNKVNTNGTLDQSALKIDINGQKYSDGLVINGVKIGGIDEYTSISSIMSKINSSNAGVKATYVSATGQFMLVSSETGAGREITLDSELAKDLFGGERVSKDAKLGETWGKGLEDGEYLKEFSINGVKIDGITKDTTIEDLMSKINASGAGVKAEYIAETGELSLVPTDSDNAGDVELTSDLAKKILGGKAGIEYGKNAVIDVSYGNGVTVQMERASNTFNLEGLTVTVSGTFGGKYEDVVDENGKVTGQEWKADTSESVSFSAKADVDKAVEKVKAFFEAFNEIVTEVNTQVTSRPDSSYGPLTEEQKNEMSEKSIENWEKKAKTGLLNNDSTIRELSMAIQSVFSQVMNNGASYDDLKKIGITYSDNPKDGGVLVFDESAFRSAMETEPETVSKIFTGGGEVKKGLMQVVEDTFTPYATRFATRNGGANSKTGGSYGRLIEEAGSEKIPTSLLKNQIYRQIEDKKTLIQQLREKLKTEEDRYIKQFSTMESLISQMNSQSSYLSQLMG